jgi:hypothetical protein
MTAITATQQDYARRHLRFGWWSLLIFASAGLALELLHGFKVRAYLDVSNETRRLMWTLAHAHGTLMGLVHIVFGLSLAAFPDFSVRHLRVISRSLTAASVLLPGGFFLAGIAFYSGDPGVGVLVVPAGAVLLLVALYLTARGIPSAARPAQKFPSKGPRLQDR